VGLDSGALEDTVSKGQLCSDNRPTTKSQGSKADHHLAEPHNLVVSIAKNSSMGL
jgi:hypothetical protein